MLFTWLAFNIPWPQMAWKVHFHDLKSWLYQCGSANIFSSLWQFRVYNIVCCCERWFFLLCRCCSTWLCRDTRFPNAFLNSFIRMVYTRGFTIQLAKYSTAIILWTSTFNTLCHFFFISSGMELWIAQGRRVRTETPVTINKVTDSFLSLWIEKSCCEWGLLWTLNMMMI